MLFGDQSNPATPSSSAAAPATLRTYIPSLIPPGVDPAKVDSKMFYTYVPNTIKTRKRTTRAQLEILEGVYGADKKPNAVSRKELAKKLEMSPREVQVWFQNRRAKERASAKKVPSATSPARGHAPAQSPPLHIPKPSDDLHPTLSCWIKNMNKLSSLIDHLQELASSAPTHHRSQLLRQVAALRATSKKQQGHFVEFLQLSEEYANKYLLDISAEIQQQSSFLDKLEGRLEAAKKLRGEALDLQMFYESGTVATMKDLRATAISRPLPEDHALFSEVDLVLAEIRQCYKELDKFWTEEISHAIEALKMRRIDPTDFDRWKNFHANIKQTIESWKNEVPSGDSQTIRCDNAGSSKEADIGAMASSLSSAMGLLTSALDRLPSSNSIKYSKSGRSYIQRVYVAFAANSDLCLSFLRRCADYSEVVFACCLPSIAPPTTPSREVASHDLWERTMKLQSEMKGASVENTVSVQGSRKFKAAYNQALRLEQKTTSYAVLEKIPTWVLVTDGHALSSDPLPDVITLEQLRKLWEKARCFVRAALAILENESAPELFYRSTPLAWTRPLFVMKRWMINHVHFL